MNTDRSDQPWNVTDPAENCVDVDSAGTIAALDEVEAYKGLLTGVDWAALGHAYGPATEAPKMLAALLDPDQSTRTKALSYLHDPLNHQNTLYEATVPAALYVAAILSDPRTTRTVDKDRRSFPGCLRAELLSWIASVANEVTDEAEALSRRHGYALDDYPPAAGVQRIRPLLFSASLPYTDDTDRPVCEAALAACIPLLDDPRLLRHQRPLVPLVREVLGTSELWQHRERAIDALDAWGEDSSGLEGQRNPFLFCDSDLPTDGSSAWLTGPNPAEGYGEEPPF
ncbi:hypothetical protein [Streptomyces sp. CMSTAAHL-2]|uniref:hypothetical protein n=1 Tax=Streptomyces sp. CMSTAAHL-2 TaxID=2904522 RepID=UPI001E4C4559|nr:hypothetical protein [Streptomyces sp. CMSTAAHL-2]MCE3031652.1 hypothetical protein [Streptomyces sp. CMSTAAHL-2]